MLQQRNVQSRGRVDTSESRADHLHMAEVDYYAACMVTDVSDGEDGLEQHPIRVCVIDLGTNSFHTLIVDVFPNGSFEVIDKFKEMVRLGERGFSGESLTGNAVKRSLRALKRVKMLAEGWGATEYLAFATSAIREASNGGELIEKIRRETGIHVRPIDGVFEAQLIYQGVRRALDMRQPALMVDIGGGSTEFIIGTSQEVYFATSLKLGAARMSREFVTSDPVDGPEFRAMREHFRVALEPVLQAAREHGVEEIVGSSGTFENIAQVCANHFGDSNRSIFLQAFRREDLRAVTKSIMTSTRSERRRMDAIDEKRVDQIVAGATLIDVLTKDLDVRQVRVSPNALREGMVVYFIRDNYERLERVSPYADVRRRSVFEVGHRFGWDLKHAQHVTAMALLMFDLCRPLHGLGRTDRELLEYASLLHDIGYYISRSSHHKHSLYLIKQADWTGFQPEEIDVMAHVARYHRRSTPKDRHAAYRRLSPDQQKLVNELASFLRLANGLDRSHFQNVQNLRAELSDEELTLFIRTKADPQLDLWGGRRASDLFERTYGLRVRILAELESAPIIDMPAGVKARELIG